MQASLVEIQLTGLEIFPASIAGCVVFAKYFRNSRLFCFVSCRDRNIAGISVNQRRAGIFKMALFLLDEDNFVLAEMLQSCSAGRGVVGWGVGRGLPHQQQSSQDLHLLPVKWAMVRQVNLFANSIPNVSKFGTGSSSSEFN